MIRVEEADVDWALDQVRSYDKEALCLSDKFWTVEIDGVLVVLGGVFRRTLVSPVELWVVPLAGFEAGKFSFARIARSLMRKVCETYPKVIAHADPDEPRHVRFLEFLGLRRVRTEVDAHGKEWLLYEARK